MCFTQSLTQFLHTIKGWVNMHARTCHLVSYCCHVFWDDRLVATWGIEEHKPFACSFFLFMALIKEILRSLCSVFEEFVAGEQQFAANSRAVFVSLCRAYKSQLGGAGCSKLFQDLRVRAVGGKKNCTFMVRRSWPYRTAGIVTC